MNQLLYGSNPEEKILAIYPVSDHSMRIYAQDCESIISREIEFYPFFFLSNTTYLKQYPAKYWLKELSGNNYFRYICAFTNWPEMWDATRYIMERYNENAPTKIESYSELPIIHLRADPVSQFLLQTGRTLFKGMEFNDLHRMQIDIATYTKPGYKFSDARRLEDRIIIIALSDNRGWEYVIHGKQKTEKEMLLELVQIIQERNADVIEGHNIFNFDLPYILTRCGMLGIDFTVGRDGSSPRSIDSRVTALERSADYISYDIAGRHIIDTLMLLQAYDASKRSFESYNLKYAAQHFGFAKKDRVYVQPEKISMCWQNDPDQLIQYSLDEIYETHQLSEYLSPSLFYLTQILPFNYSTTARLGSSAKIESLLLREYIRQKCSISKPEAGVPLTGGYTNIFYSGILGPIIDVDIESLYPSIMLNENIFPKSETLGIFLSLLKHLTNMRLDAKRTMEASKELHERTKYDAIQSSFKTLINSFYGYLGYSRALFNDYQAADKVTQTGQRILTQLMALINQRDGIVVEVDTDGVFFVPPNSIKNEYEEKRFVDTLSSLLPPGINLQMNGRYKQMLSYKKKNYALLGYDDKIKIKGSSLISRNIEKFGRIFIQQCIGALLNNNIVELHELYVTYYKNISAHKFNIPDFAKIETLKENLDSYSNAVNSGNRNRMAAYEVAVRSGLNWKPGDRISYYIVGDEANPKNFEHCKPAQEWDPNFPDENVQHYLRRLDEFAKKFEVFFTPQDFQRIFSVEDLFGFSAEGIKILTHPILSSDVEPGEDEAELFHVAPKIWLDESLSLE